MWRSLGPGWGAPESAAIAGNTAARGGSSAVQAVAVNAAKATATKGHTDRFLPSIQIRIVVVPPAIESIMPFTR